MKGLLVSGILALGIFTFNANAVETADNPLQITMKAMSSDLKKIVAQANVAANNASSAALADHFVTLVKKAKDILPDTADTETMKSDYAKMMDGMADLGKKLAEAFRANDNALANSILNQMVQAKKDGHSEFKKD